jgi:hypothetical protein
MELDHTELANQIIVNVGSTICLFFNKQGQPKFTIGPHWPLFISMFSTISVISLFLLYMLETSFWFKVAGMVSTCLLLLVYTCTALVNPGMEL